MLVNILKVICFLLILIYQNKTFCVITSEREPEVKKSINLLWSKLSSTLHNAEHTFERKLQPSWEVYKEKVAPLKKRKKPYDCTALSKKKLREAQQLEKITKLKTAHDEAASDALTDYERAIEIHRSNKESTISYAYATFLQSVNSILKNSINFKEWSARVYIINYHPKIRRRLQDFRILERHHQPPKKSKRLII